jgi:hypothetical protein
VSASPRYLLAAVLLAGCQGIRTGAHHQAAGPSGVDTPAVFAGSAWPEADRLFHRDPRWLGADAAFSVDLGSERVLWLFGDTFVATSARNVRRESRMVRNSLAVQHGRDPSSADMTFCWKPGPASWLPEQDESWFWPQHGVRLPSGPLILFWSRVHATPGEGLGFAADGWAAVLVDNPDDPPDRWHPRVLDTPAFPQGLIPAQGLMIEGDFVYGLAIREPGNHAAYALRIPVAALARGDLAQIELWSDGWSPATAHSTPTPVMSDAGPEMSLHFDERLRRYVHVRSLGFGATTLAVATAEHLTGPWSSYASVYRPPESDGAGAFVYAGKAHPELTGADLVATYASNSFDFATLVRDTSLYYPRFVRLTYR